MSFNSLPFIAFLVALVCVYRRLSITRQNAFLLAASYVFYCWWDWRFGFLLMASTVVDFFVGLRLGAATVASTRKKYLAVSIVFNLSVLCFFKYFGFFVDSISLMLNEIGLRADMPVLRVILPLGISFYTFKTMTYTIDVYRKQMPPETRFVNYALYVSFFPQLAAGPIDRARNLLPQIGSPREVSRQQFIDGLSLMIMGFFKKVAIADTLAPIVDKVFSAPGSFSSGELLSGMYAYAFQIYGDFSGYTDIARGVALLLGFNTMENFRTPYFSRNITDFWRRWHISLSTWFRDYVYIGLGGNRAGKIRTYLNLLITMVLCGFWHGAAWTFVAWGTAHGVYLSLHRLLFGKVRIDAARSGSFLYRINELVKILLTFHLVAFTWIAFRAPDFETVLVYLRGIFRFDGMRNFDYSILFACGLIFILDVIQETAKTNTWLLNKATPWPIRYALPQMLLVAIAVASIAHVNTIAPFIYFQF
jgi:D-alanyl-lipoteichoic acid acyltransferase DltB (MBOAT superfamily)